MMMMMMINWRFTERVGVGQSERTDGMAVANTALCKSVLQAMRPRCKNGTHFECYGFF